MYVGGGLDGKKPTGYASQCISCGKCVKVCTQHIDIPTELKGVRKTMESPTSKVMFSVMRPAMNFYMERERKKNLKKART